MIHAWALALYKVVLLASELRRVTMGALWKRCCVRQDGLPFIEGTCGKPILTECNTSGKDDSLADVAKHYSFQCLTPL